jgi:hypothetical protein
MELEQFYNEQIKRPGLPEFSALSDADKSDMTELLSYALWKYGKAMSELGDLVMEPIVKLIERFKRWRNL